MVPLTRQPELTIDIFKEE